MEKNLQQKSYIGSRISERIKELNISQSELARRVGIKQPTINALILNPKTKSKYIVDIAAALGVSPDWLRYGEGDKEATAKPNQQDEGEFDALCKKWLQNLQLTANITGTPLLAAAAHYAAIEAKGLPLTKENYTKVLEAMKRIYGEETNDGSGNQTTN